MEFYYSTEGVSGVNDQQTRVLGLYSRSVLVVGALGGVDQPSENPINQHGSWDRDLVLEPR